MCRLLCFEVQRICGMGRNLGQLACQVGRHCEIGLLLENESSCRLGPLRISLSLSTLFFVAKKRARHTRLWSRDIIYSTSHVL